MPKLTVIGMGFDGGFSRFKTLAADLTKKTAVDIHHDDVLRFMDRSIFAPLPGDVTNIVAVMDNGDGVSGLVGQDAMLLQPTLWQADSTEAHYGSGAQKLFVRTALLKHLLALNVPTGEVELYLSLSLAGMHSRYAPIIVEELSRPFTLISSTGDTWQVTVASCEVKIQTFWLAVDILSRWNEKTGTLKPFDALPLMVEHYPVFLDFGSLTFQGAGYARNLNAPPVKWCERIGAWDQVRDTLKDRLQVKAAEAGIQIFDPSMQDLLTCYETGTFTIGKHRIDMTQEVMAMVRPKVEQRLRIAEQQLHGGGAIGEMYLAGGDVYRNLPVFRDYYQDRIRGNVQIMTDEFGGEEPLWRIASGAFKGALRQYLTKGGKGR